MTRQEKFGKLQDLVLDKYIEALENGDLKPMELQAVVTFLKNNKMTEDKPPEPTEAELIDSLIEEIE